MASATVSRLGLVFGLVLLLLTACTAPTPSSTLTTIDTVTDPLGIVVVEQGLPIRIAALLTTSGATAPLGLDAIGGIEIALAERNNTLLGHPIDLVTLDSACTAAGGAAAARDLLAVQGVVGVIGTSCSSAAIEALPIISTAGLLMISPSNTAPSLTDPEQNWQPGYYRTIYNDLEQGRVAARFAFEQLGARTAATIHDGSPYAEQLQQVFAESFTAFGGRITRQEVIAPGDVDMTAVLNSIAVTPPNLIYLPIFEPEGPVVIQQARSLPALTNTALMSADALLNDNLPRTLGTSALNLYLSGPSVRGDRYDQFLAQWNATYRLPPAASFHAFAYDATNILLAAIETAAVQQPNGRLLIGRQALRDALTATQNFPGLTGPITCSPTGNCGAAGAIAIYQITQSELAGNWPPPPLWSP